MKIFQSRHHILAAQINRIQPHPTAKLFQLFTDAETVEVPPSWMEQNEPRMGGYVVIDAETGASGYLTDAQLVAGYELVGMHALQSNIEPAPATAGDGEVSTQKRYTFDEFVQYGIAAGGNVVDGMPWSFTFHGRAVSHENNDCYILSVKGEDGYHRTVTFYRGEVIHVSDTDFVITKGDE